MLSINTITQHERMSTQDLLLSISRAVAQGETSFDIAASGQHDIGGPLWNAEGKKLCFNVSNPGQRLGCMGLDNTEIIVHGSAPADVGWLNSGARIVIMGDAGDTAGHCAASGSIFIGGRAGTRSGSLMKHDPLYPEPELWILKNTGSFSCEFMGGGKMVVCGWDCKECGSVLGERACTGMVGGTVFFRGNPGSFSASDVALRDLDPEDQQFLSSGMDAFLASIGRQELHDELTKWKEWHKLVPIDLNGHHDAKIGLTDYRIKSWIKGGIFSDVVHDDFNAAPLVGRGKMRLRIPSWDNGACAAPCEYSCPSGIPTQKRFSLLRQGRQEEALRLVLEYSPFPGSVCGAVCPNPCMEACTRGQDIDFALQIGELGRLSAQTRPDMPLHRTQKSVAVVGSGAAGLSAAWQLARMGHSVTVYEADAVAGGKLEQAIPRARLSHDILKHEIERIAGMGVTFATSCKVDKNLFAKLRAQNDAVIVAVGGTKSRIFDWKGKERIVSGLEFMKAVNRGEHPKVGRDVIVIGCGNAGMDAAAGAYAMGAGSVVCIDVQKPAAFAKEIEHITSLGGKLIWPVITKEITKDGVLTEDGGLIPGDMVIITIGEEPEIDFLPENVNTFRGHWLAVGNDCSILPGVFAAGDVIKPGLLTAAIGSGRKAALAADAWMKGKRLESTCRPMAKKSLHLEYFEKVRRDELPAAFDDCNRCVSCGTCRDCGMCLDSCPQKAIHRMQTADETGFAYASDPERCIGCGICAGVCPCGVWTIKDNEPLN